MTAQSHQEFEFLKMKCSVTPDLGCSPSKTLNPNPIVQLEYASESITIFDWFLRLLLISNALSRSTKINWNKLQLEWYVSRNSLERRYSTVGATRERADRFFIPVQCVGSMWEACHRIVPPFLSSSRLAFANYCYDEIVGRNRKQENTSNRCMISKHRFL